MKLEYSMTPMGKGKLIPADDSVKKSSFSGYTENFRIS